MCSPTLFAVAGGGQAILSHMGANQAADARNRNRARLYQNQVSKLYQQHNADLTQFYHRGVDAEIRWAENAKAANRGAQIEQVKLNQKIAAAYLEQETTFVKYMQGSKVAKSLERSGASARRVAIARKALLGRAKATRRAEIDMQRDLSAGIYEQINARRKMADWKAQQLIGSIPERGREPQKPIWDKGPGMLSLIVNTAIGAASGYYAAKGLGLGTEKVVAGGAGAGAGAGGSGTHAATANQQWISTGAGQGYWHTVPQNSAWFMKPAETATIASGKNSVAAANALLASTFASNPWDAANESLYQVG